MTNLLGLVNGVSTFVKVGWICWLAWIVLQLKWYRAVRELSAPEPAPVPVSDDETAGWPPLSTTTRHTTLLGGSRSWGPVPAQDTPVLVVEQTAAATITPIAPLAAIAAIPDGWPDLASDESPMVHNQDTATTRRSDKRRRRAIAGSSPSAA